MTQDRNTRSSTLPNLSIKNFTTTQDYADTFEQMKNFTLNRDGDTQDEIWILQHNDVLTQGIAGKAEHILMPMSDLPVVQTDRGGQVTWHGRGQLVVYFLLDLNRLKWHVRDLVDFAENMMIWLCQQYGIDSYAKKDAPGIYVGERKIGSLGFKIRRGRSYHGFALNVNCELTGFQTINPCGYAGLEMVRLCDLNNENLSFQTLAEQCQQYIASQNIYQQVQFETI
ncbi:MULTISPECIES: lipoyl(octanoyl) transferase LipB [unclassified Acinetobacter]|uniref:lipoyl(octanoyl) transferase LipB n=1 Tax=unclassified Acinetobacter TaxID=196816 RepID=UPI0035B7206F